MVFLSGTFYEREFQPIRGLWLGERMTLADILTAYAAGKRDFRGITLEMQTGFECDLRGADFSDGCLDNSYLAYAKLQRANLQRTQLRLSELSNAQLQAATLDRADLSGSNLAYTNLNGASLQGVNLTEANLYGANLQRADLTQANLTGANLTGAELTGAILKDAQLAGCNCFRAQGIDFDKAKCDRTTIYPDGHRNNIPE
ncbi:MAG: pentapeptide repeat-containing protein [Cyanobacteria bacterium J06626_23]